MLVTHEGRVSVWMLPVYANVCDPWGQLQTPSAQVPPPQAWKHEPQFMMSVCKFAHSAPASPTPPSGMHSVRPVPHAETHEPAVHVSMVGRHVVVQLPQWLGSVLVVTHVVPPSPLGQDVAPPVQPDPPEHFPAEHV